MNYKQIAAMVNEVFADTVGIGVEDPDNPGTLLTSPVEEDLGNLVEVGKKITSSTAFGDNFDNYQKKIIDKVGKTIFRTDSFKKKHLPILKDGFEYGAILEKLRCEAGDYTEDFTWDTLGTDPNGDSRDASEIFSIEPATVSAKYFSGSTTFKAKVSLPRRQLKSAFTSASAMARLVGMIEQRIEYKLDIVLYALEHLLVDNLIAEKEKSFRTGTNKITYINLIKMYHDETGDTSVDKDNCLMEPEFLRWMNLTFGKHMSYLTEPTVIYNDGGFVTNTPKNMQEFILLTDVVQGLKTYLYSDTRHEDYVKLDNFTEIAYWQTGGQNMGINTRWAINVIPASERGSLTPHSFNQSGILGVLFDERALAITSEHIETTSIPVPDVRYDNYWTFRDAGYMCDTDENAIVFYVDDYEFSATYSTQPDDWATIYSKLYTKDGDTYTAATSTFAAGDYYVAV